MRREWKKNESVSARKLNSHSAALSQSSGSGSLGESSKIGSMVSISKSDLVDTGLWVRIKSFAKEDNLTEGTRAVYRHSWEAIYFDNWTQNWRIDKSRFGDKDIDPVYSKDFKGLEVTKDSAFDPSVGNSVRPKIHPYFVVRDPVTRNIFDVGPSGASDITENFTNTVILILGTYDEYKYCPELYGVPAPPLGKTYTCSNGTSVLIPENCPTYYAWSEYVVCGYKLVKTGRSIKNYKWWASEINGAGVSVTRGFYQPFFGNTAPPNSLASISGHENDQCDGIKYLGFGSRGSVNCDCPSWILATKCLKIKFRTVARPAGDVTSCYMTRNIFDEYDLWDKTIEIPLCVYEGGEPGLEPVCGWGGTDSPNQVFSVNIEHHVFVSGLEEGKCFFGPPVFDPCKPCNDVSDFWGNIDISGDDDTNCNGPGHVTFKFKYGDILALSRYCRKCQGATAPSGTYPFDIKLCNACDNLATPPSPFHFILPGTIELVCCSESEFTAC